MAFGRSPRTTDFIFARFAQKVILHFWLLVVNGATYGWWMVTSAVP